VSCAGSPKTYEKIDAHIGTGSYDLALQAIEAEVGAKNTVYIERNAILFYLDKGMINFYAGNYSSAIEDLQEAERLIEEAFTKSLTLEAASFLANDNAKEYPGEDYEDLYINVFKALSFYYMNNVEGAMVEIRKVNEKLRYLASKYETAKQKVASSDSNVSTSNVTFEAARFSNSALARYLSLLFYRAIGNEDSVRIDLEELRRAYELAPVVYGHSPPSSLADEQFIPQGMARLNIIGFTGLSPIKEEDRSRFPLPLPNNVNNTAVLALPRIVERPSAIESIEVVLNTGERFRLELLEDMSKVAEETFKERYGVILAKTVARTIIKNIASATASTVGDQLGGTAGAILAVGGLIGKAASDLSEAADVRIARYFPGRAHVGGVNLEPGSYSISITYYGSGGSIVARDERDVVIRENALNLVQFVCLR
jgi:hypothetical protein